VIGYGAPHKQGKEESHGAPLGKDEVASARERLGWKYPPFEIPDEIYAAWDHRAKGAAVERDWQNRFAAYAKAHPDLAAEFERRQRGELPADWAAKTQAYIEKLQAEGPEVASRKASQMALDAFGPLLPELFGGSADLAGSNLTLWKGSVPLASDNAAQANYAHYGVREFGMSAICNGIARHGGFIPYDATFLVFSDYARNAVRMSALIPAQVVHVYTHDSIGLGEDGPTHQPIEHLASLRLIPNLDVWRPADRLETVIAWQMALEQTLRPTCLVLSRQDCRCVAPDEVDLTALRRGGYILEHPADGADPQLVLVATGSEVALALDAAGALRQQGVAVQVVSMPCTQVFDRQSASYRNMVLPPGVPRLVIEAASSAPWYRYVGGCGEVLGIDCFGESGPGLAVLANFGFTMDHVLQRAQALLAGTR
jgi:transketolase